MRDKEFIEKFLLNYGTIYSYYREFKSGWLLVTDAIKELLIEKNIRQNRYALKIKEKHKHYSASSLGNFTFCPASFSIEATFQIDYPNAEKEREVGNWIFRTKVHHYSAAICTSDSRAKYTSFLSNVG